tara:strand:+ start:2846 stop:2980 length:135 start_codon:yes stop_codon:yes gene_type:complete
MAEEKVKEEKKEEPKVVITPDEVTLTEAYRKTSKKATRGTLDRV